MKHKWDLAGRVIVRQLQEQTSVSTLEEKGREARFQL